MDLRSERRFVRFAREALRAREEFFDFLILQGFLLWVVLSRVGEKGVADRCDGMMKNKTV